MADPKGVLAYVRSRPNRTVYGAVLGPLVAYVGVTEDGLADVGRWFNAMGDLLIYASQLPWFGP